LMPAIVLTDPRLIMAEPPLVTFNAAMIALAHATDAYTASDKNPFKDAYAFTAIQLIMANLIKVIQKRTGSKGRMALVNAISMAGCTRPQASASHHIALSLTEVLARATSEYAHLEYGVCLGLLLAFTLEYHLSLESTFGADLLLPLSDADTFALTAPHLRTPVALNKLHSLLYHLHFVTNGKIPRTLAEAGVPRFILGDIAEKAVASGLKGFSFDDYHTVLKHAWSDRPFPNKTD